MGRARQSSRFKNNKGNYELKSQNYILYLQLNLSLFRNPTRIINGKYKADFYYSES